MSNPLVLFGISFMTPDGKEVFVDSRELAEWQEKYGDRLNERFAKRCGKCKHFIGGGDWNLCCDLPHDDYPCGFLCYEDTVACKDFEEGKYEWHYDGSRFEGEGKRE